MCIFKYPNQPILNNVQPILLLM